jgi:hypothetical protein
MVAKSNSRCTLVGGAATQAEERWRPGGLCTNRTSSERVLMARIPALQAVSYLDDPYVSPHS